MQARPWFAAAIYRSIMTIRDHLKRRVRIFFALAVLGWLICAGSMFVMNPYTRCRPACGNHTPPAPVLLGLPIFLAAVVGLTFLVKCPRCGGRFGALAGSLVARGFLSRAVNFCPYCGVNLDDIYDQQP
jgi:hypothetical protein